MVSLLASIPDPIDVRGQDTSNLRINQFDSLFASLSQDEREISTDTCKVFVLKGKSVGLVCEHHP